jgi:hypothetical protein
MPVGEADQPAYRSLVRRSLVAATRLAERTVRGPRATQVRLCHRYPQQGEADIPKERDPSPSRFQIRQ